MKLTRLCQLFLIASLLLAVMGSTPQPAFAAKAQPVLVEMALQDPGQMVRVIVQKADKATRVEDMVARLGGQVLHDLGIINAFSAEMSAEAALKLARTVSVRWVSLDGSIEHSSKPIPDPNAPPNYYLDTLGVPDVWNMGLKGEGIGVAVIDSGIFTDRDFSTEVGSPHMRIVGMVNLNDEMKSVNDEYGHGTHVAGIIGGNGGSSPNTQYAGIAPKVNLINLKVNDDTTGMCYESNVVAALQWVYNNKDQYNIRVVNLSLNTTVEQSYNLSPMDAAVEILWFNGVVVVASAGNNGPAGGYNTSNASPANDPFIITVGASEENGTSDRTDDNIGLYSAFGTTINGFVKPDIIAPGTNIYSVLSNSSTWAVIYPGRTVLGGEYFRLSGTSMAAPMVTGAVVLLLQDEPNLTPDQVKYRLTHTGETITNDNVAYPYLNIYAAVTGTTTQSANTGILPSQMLSTGTEPITWNSVGWNSVGWNSVGWNSVGWNSVGWNSVGWNSTYWGP